MHIRSKKLVAPAMALALVCAPFAALAQSTNGEADDISSRLERAGEAARQAVKDAAGATGAAARDAADATKSLADRAAEATDRAAQDVAEAADHVGIDTVFGGVPEGAYFAADILDRPVLDTAGEKLGEISNIVIAPDWTVDALVVGVGGILGIGEKDVAVNVNDFKFVTDAGGEVTLTLDTTEDELKAAPAFVRPSEQQAAD